MNKLILASSSPRRRELLAQIGIPQEGCIFEVIPSRIEEKATGNDPAEMVRALSAMKAEDVFEIQEKEQREGFLVIGADTVVSLNGQIMGKPADEQDAVRMLTALQGNTHQVYTGVTLICRKKAGMPPSKVTFCEKTDVTMYAMSRKEISDYVNTGEPLDKAGAYGIQGRFAAFIREICGDYNNVVGLPLGRVYQEMKKLLTLG